MLRLMDVKLLLLCALLVLPACGASTADESPVRDAATEKLLGMADAAAQRNGGQAQHVEVVETTRARAADLDGHSNRDQAEKVWVVQVSGDHYVCKVCHQPRRGTPPSGGYISLVVRASDYEVTDSGLGPQAADLSSLGAVQVLRE